MILVFSKRSPHVRFSVTSTHIKISQLVASLPTRRQKVVVALLDTRYQQECNKLLTICNNLVNIIRLVARLFQQVSYSPDITILLQPCVVNLVTFLLYEGCIQDFLEQPYNKSDNVIKLVTMQVVDSLYEICCNNMEQAVRTQLSDNLLTNL